MRLLKGDHCQCTACGDYFNSTAAFDKHRWGDWDNRHCKTQEQMFAAGMALSGTGWWLTAKRDDSSLPFERRNGDRSESVGEQGGMDA
jgi:predicted nucleic acid-binding Zn ribbon protein